MLVIYAATIFVSATLLFLVQPMFARMVLPLLGGSPAVWNTALVFFQATLLAGYAYTHVTTTRLGVRRQAALHLGLLLLPFLFVLPIRIPAGSVPPTTSTPIPWLLTVLLVSVGLPFFVVATSSPLLQKWFAATGHRAGADPYFLYVASNLGSMLGLLSYPAMVEPTLRLADQSRLWFYGYVLLVLLMFACALLLWRSPPAASRAAPEDEEAAVPPPEVVTRGASVSSSPGAQRIARWVLLSFVPSSLMLSVTTYISTDIAAIPLLWVIPLALYLLTFILVFAQKPPIPHFILVRAMPILLLIVVLTLATQAVEPLKLLLPLHLATFFVLAMVCHGELAQDRPPPAHLTAFYLWMSVGGVLGGAFNALLAPLIFNSVTEYPLVLALACWAGLRRDPRPESDEQRRRRYLLDSGLPLLLAVLTIALVVGVPRLAGFYGWKDLKSGPLTLAAVFALPLVLCFSFARRPLRFALGVAAILLAGRFYHSGQAEQTLVTERSFFGIVRITSRGNVHEFIHGGTLHGMQNLAPTQRRVPLTYYYPSGPIGQVFTALGSSARHVAAVGLGTGAIACYGQPGQQFTFYEIDPVVERIARDPRYFTYLSDSRAHIEVVLGDARLSLAGTADGQYDLIILDAYSSDSIPVHLITREAAQLYLKKLKPHGILAFHISNRHLDLEPVLANLARDARLATLTRNDDRLSQKEINSGKTKSSWLVVGRRRADFGKLATDKRWNPSRTQSDAPVWTDDYSSLLSVFSWK